MVLRILLFGTALLLCTGAGAQVDSLGQWTSLQSFAKGEYVTESPESIIYTTGNAIFYLDKDDLSITRLTRTDGLAGGRIDLLKYHPPTETLIIVYENSTIDLLRRGGDFFTLRQIDNFNFSGDKRIYDVSFGTNNRVYLAAGYGVSALSLNDRTFTFTTFTGVRVAAVAEHAGSIYAATDEGLYRVPLSGTNINDFNSWSLLGFADGLPGDYSSTAVTVWRDRLYFGVNEDVWTLDAGSPRVFYDTEVRGNRLQYLSGGPTRLLAGYRCTIVTCTGRAVVALEDNGATQELRNCSFLTNYALEDDRGRIWYGDDAEDIRYRNGLTGGCEKLAYPGPPDDDNYRLLHDGTSLWVAPGPIDENGGPDFSFDGVYRFTDGSWTVYNNQNTPAFRGRDGQLGGDDDFATVIDVSYDAVNDVHYFSSFFEGLIGLDREGQATLYDETNSSIQLAPDAGAGRIRVAGTATDPAGFTYVAVSRAAQGGIVAVRGPGGEWAVTGQSCDLNIAFDVAIDQQGYVWVLHRGGSNGGLTVIDPMGTPLDPSDDRCRTITASNSALPTNELRSIAVDLDGSVWVGTALGIVIFNCGSAVFDTERCPGTRPAVAADDGFGGLLLETVEVRSIAVDGGNRKWIGTAGGAFLLSEDGSEQLLFFDRGNSPLLDNVINDIAINPNTGTVYFGTELGIISYRSDATRAGESFAPELVVFPNPVEPGYDGPIAISGLARDARVKITDVSGKLVEEGVALGGQFTWSGRDYNGRRVTSGVYLIFASSAPSFGLAGASSGAAAVGKIVFVR